MIKTKDVVSLLKSIDLEPYLIGKYEDFWYIFKMNEFDLEQVNSIENHTGKPQGKQVFINGIPIEPYDFQFFDSNSVKLIKDYFNTTKKPIERLNKVNSCLAVQLFEFIEFLWKYAKF